MKTIYFLIRFLLILATITIIGLVVFALLTDWSKIAE